MLSGIGPSPHLKQLGIPVLADLPVGSNLQDHYGSMALVGTTIPEVKKRNYHLLTSGSQVSIREARFLSIPSMLQYVANGAGPLTSLGGVEGLAWINTKFANKSEDRPDLEIMFVSGSIVADSGTVKTVQGVTDRVFDNLYRPLLGRDTFSFLIQVTRPTSRCSKTPDRQTQQCHPILRGFVKLRSRNPFDKPIFEAGYFNHPHDIKVD